MKIEHQNRLNFNLKLVIQMGIFLIGVGILVWQSQSTFATFFSFRTTVAISTETSLSLPPPTIVLCQEHKWNNGMNDEYPVNMSDKDWVFKQFYQLNKEMNISIFDIDLTVGNNSLSIDGIWEGALGGPDIIFMVKEFLNPWKGLCYAIIPDPKTHMKLENYFYVKVRFSQEIKNPMVSAYLISSEDWHGFFLFQFGGLKPFKIPLTELKTVIGISIEQRKYFHVEDAFYLPLSLTNCMDYSSGEDSYMKCIVKSIVKNFENKTNATTGWCKNKVPFFSRQRIFILDPIYCFQQVFWGINFCTNP